MQKNEYLANGTVTDFTRWLQEVARDDTGRLFRHRYEFEPRGRAIDGRPWHCEGLFDAKVKYEWPFRFSNFDSDESVAGRTYEENETSLEDISEKLGASVVDEGDHVKCYQSCIMTLDWGGVLGSATKGNKKHVNDFGDVLVEYLKKTKILFESADISLCRKYTVIAGSRPRPVIMNAGFTKIYSLLCNNFVIYDGRVGAALGFLARRYQENNNPGEAIPEEISFYFGRAKNPNVNRNPSDGNYQFRALSASNAVHIRNNLKANWLLENALKGECGRFNDQKDPMRSFEAALFMIGYKV